MQPSVIFAQMENITDIMQLNLSSGFLRAAGLCAGIGGDCRTEDSATFLVALSVMSQGRGLDIPEKSPFLDAVSLTPGRVRDALAGYGEEAFTPVIRFASGDGAGRSAVLSAAEELILRQAGYGRNVAAGVKYIISETVDNIAEHSLSPSGFMASRSHLQEGYTDICIADPGRTLLGSYLAKGPDGGIRTDIEAIQAATEGLSTKNRPEAESRGFGIRTTRKMLAGGLGGEYLLASGRALYGQNRTERLFVELPEGCRLEGTLVALRIPHRAEGFNYISFIE